MGSPKCHDEEIYYLCLVLSLDDAFTSKDLVEPAAYSGFSTSSLFLCLALTAATYTRTKFVARFVDLCPLVAAVEKLSR